MFIYGHLNKDGIYAHKGLNQRINFINTFVVNDFYASTEIVEQG